MAWIHSHYLQWKFKLLTGKVTWCNKAKHCWVMSTNFLFSNVCWQCPEMFCLYTSSKLPPIIWIFTEGEGDGPKFRLHFQILTRIQMGIHRKIPKRKHLKSFFFVTPRMFKSDRSIKVNAQCKIKKNEEITIQYFFRVRFWSTLLI